MTIQISKHLDVGNPSAGIGMRVEARSTTNVIVITDRHGRETRFYFNKDGRYAGYSSFGRTRPT